jgi:hypothetical protein
MISKKAMLTLCTVIICQVWTLGQVNPNHLWVDGYYKSDGTYIHGHYRTAPNQTNRDNFTTKPNINPYNGRKGFIEPDDYVHYPSFNNDLSYEYSSKDTGNNNSKTEFNWKVDSRSNFKGIYLNMPFESVRELVLDCYRKDNGCKSCFVDTDTNLEYSLYGKVKLDGVIMDFKEDKVVSILMLLRESVDNTIRSKNLKEEVIRSFGKPSIITKDYISWSGKTTEILLFTQEIYDQTIINQTFLLIVDKKMIE